MTERKAFSFLRSFYEAACTITNKEEQADFYNAIFRYAFDGEESGITGTPLAMFMLAKPNIDSSLKKSEAGALGGSTRQGRYQNNDKQDVSNTQANDKQDVSNTQANDKQDVSNTQAIKDKGSRINDKGEVIKDKGVSKTLDRFETEFGTFWQEYPKKVGKGAAKKAFEKAVRKTSIESLVTAVRRQKCGSQWSEEGGRFIPNPATWLNQERWEDEVYITGGNNNPARGTGQPSNLPHGKNDYQAGMAQAMEILRRNRECDNDG